MSDITLAIDCMGTDLGPHVVVEACCQAAIKHPQLKQILVGDKNTLSNLVNAFFSNSVHEASSVRDNISFEDADVVIDMHEKVSSALRKRHQSSMGKALTLVAEGSANGCVSGGNTAALLILSRAYINLLPGIERPAMSTVLPNEKGFTRVLDLGANIDCNSESLFYFGVMGSIVAKIIDGIDNPKVGLLNVGVEEAKGSDKVKQAAALLQQQQSINYHGFVEGNEIFTGMVDVVVCDGFVGNSVLKASEGIASFFGHLINNKLLSGFRGRLMKWLMRPALNRLKDEINPEKYNGASFLGLEKVVVKSHGAANAIAICFAIEEAMQQVHFKVPEKINNALENLEYSED